MSFPRHTQYKDSGIEWLGVVPGHWEVRRLRRSFYLLTEKTDRRTFPVALENIESWSGRFLHSETEFEGEGVAFSVGDILFGKLRPYLAKVLLATRPGEAIGDLHVFRPAADIEGRFAQYHILSREFISLVDGSTYGAKMPRASWDIMAGLFLAVPPKAEQSAIAAFLDRETAKIDALVDEQEKLIALLAEKRQAVISQAVTKGLNPAALMKDSGIEWLGQVPEHWALKRIKHLTRTIEQGWSPQCENFPIEAPEEWGVLKVGCVNGGSFSPRENKSLPAELEPLPELGIMAGDLLISRANTRELVGSAAVPDKDYRNLMLSDKLYRIRLHSEAGLPEFLGRYLATDPVRGQIELSATGASNSMLNIGQSTVLELAIAVPPLSEQAAIVTFLDDEHARMDALVFAATQAIGLLKEHRSALISAAVTGKIDVRRLVNAEAA
jgi:type I restriction enzyme S subunit